MNWCAKLNLALVSEGVVSKKELQRSLPTPHQLAEYGRKSPDTLGGDKESAPIHNSHYAPHVLAGLVVSAQAIIVVIGSSRNCLDQSSAGIVV